MIKITYVCHSCFVVELKKEVFIFDYYKGTLPSISKEKSVFVFSSHGHFDHYNDEIFKIGKDRENITFILSDDISRDAIVVAKKSGIHENQIHFVAPNKTYSIENCTIKTLKSTDEGVAFFLEYDDVVIYHAGDLNWWHWKGEKTSYNEMMKRKYKHEIGKMESEKIDVAFVSVDPNLKEAYYYGIDYFMKHTDTREVFPMHFGMNYDICKKLKKEKQDQSYIDRVNIISRMGEVWEIADN